MSSFSLTVNNVRRTVSAEPDTPLLWVLRDLLNLKGSKYGCGIGVCGSCTIHLNGEAVRSCTLPVSSVAKSRITTIEGLSDGGDHPVQQAWVEVDVPQCGYCQPGQVMTAAALLSKNFSPSAEDINTAMAGNICRCGTYNRIRKAIALAARKNNE